MSEPERRQLTVMFCDLVGSTQLSERFDPEELMDILRGYQAICSRVARRFEARIRFFGDGAFVTFGYPIAHEDDGRRAVRAGMDILSAIHGMNETLTQEKGVRLEARIGIHTGLVVAGDMDDSKQLEPMAIVGKTPNIANRLQEIAARDSIAISDATYRLIEGFFECRELGPHTLRGVSRKVHVYEVLRQSSVRSRVDIASVRSRTPLVGREEEVSELMSCWRAIQSGVGHALLLQGEAGIGKSRIVRTLEAHASENPRATVTEARCSPYFQNRAFHPVIELLERWIFQSSPRSAVPERLVRLEEWATQFGISKEGVPLLAGLLSLPTDNYPMLAMTPERKRQETIAILLEVLTQEAARQSLLLVVEDLHWADPSSVELLGLIIERLPRTRMLLILTFRPDFTAPWSSSPTLSTLALDRLERTEVALMMERIAGGVALPDVVIEQVIDRSDGVPLFVEELTRIVLESGILEEGEKGYELVREPAALGIPTSLKDLLMARLDSLDANKGLVQLAAALGRGFPYECLKAVTPLDEASLRHELSQLVSAGLLYIQGETARGGQTCFFKHALIQEAAYESLLKSKRQEFHQRIARVLQERFPETAETQPELMAHHFTEGGVLDEAIGEWQRAGQRAIERSANREAVNHLQKGLELVDGLPDGPEKAQRELMLQSLLGVPLLATKGFASKEAERAYARARELCSQMGEVPQVIPTLLGMGSYHVVRAELDIALPMAEQVMRLATVANDDTLRLAAHAAIGATMFWKGEFAESEEHLEKGIELYDLDRHRSTGFVYGQDWGVVCLSHSAMALWILGYPDRALERSQEALELARQLAHPFSEAYALNFATWVRQFRGETNATRELAETEIRVAREQAFPLWLAGGTILQGWSNRSSEGVLEMSQGLAGWQATGAELATRYYLALLAEAHRDSGQVDEGLAAVRTALDDTSGGGAYFWHAELHRLRGALLAASPNGSDAEAERALRRSIELARRQGARSLELRANMSLTNALARRGEKAEARAMLTTARGGFSEGFETADLKEAERLLDSMR